MENWELYKKLLERADKNRVDRSNTGDIDKLENWTPNMNMIYTYGGYEIQILEHHALKDPLKAKASLFIFGTNGTTLQEYTFKRKCLVCEKTVQDCLEKAKKCVQQRSEELKKYYEKINTV